MAATYDDVMKTTPYLPYKMGYLTEIMIQQAKEELGETEETREDALSAIRKMILAEPNLNIFTCEKHLLPFLRNQKFNVKKAYKLLLNNVQFMEQYPELYKHSREDFSEILQFWQTGALAWQPYRDEDGCPVLIYRPGNWNPDEIPMSLVLRAFSACLAFAHNEEATAVTGVRVLVDAQGCSLKHIRHVSIRYMQLMARGLRNFFPVRMKGIHVVNESVWYKYFYRIFELFLTEKIKKRVHLHGDSLQDLHKFIPKEILPTEFGGLNDTDSDTVWFPKLIEQYYDTLYELYQYGFES